MKLKNLAMVAIGALIVLGQGCGGDQQESGGVELVKSRADFSPVIARVGDWEITQDYFDFRYENLSPTEKGRFSGEGWRIRFLDSLVDEALIYDQARNEGFQNQREVEWRLDMADRSILFKAFYDYYFKDHLEVPEDRIVEFYEQNKDSYKSAGRLLGFHIQCDSKEKIDQAAADLAAGIPFGTVALKYSEDEATRDDGGMLGWFNPDGYVLGMGFNKEFTDFAFSLPVNQVSEPKKIGDHWHIVKATHKIPGETQSLEQARDRIERELRPFFAKEAFEKRVRELQREVGITYYGDYDVKETRSAEQLYRLAGETRNPQSRLGYYRSLVKNYPDHGLADDALFMMGFIHSEEFGEVGEASRIFYRLQRDYPESQWVESADWLLKHPGRSEPSLRGDALPKDASEAGQRINDVRD